VLVVLQKDSKVGLFTAGRAVRVGLLQAEQQQLNGGQLRAEQPKVNIVLQAGQ
jgi:hypothetical protein